MSASTVSITANPATASRRRPVFAGENKLPIELANADGGAGQTNAIDDNTSGGKDLSHSIRGEVMVGRSKDLIQVKKSLPTSTVSPRRTRKAVTKPEKPRWQTIVSVFTKNFMLLLVLIGLAQIVRKLTLKSADSSVGLISSEVADIEGRIAEVEGFLKTTTKMMQVQVEVVDKKIENEVSGLRRELGKKIDDKSFVLENGLKKLDSRANILEKSFGELREMDLVTKEEFERFYEAFKKAKEDDSGDRYVSLDDLRAYAREVVAKEIEKHAADGLGWVDYALAAGGAAVLKHSDPYVVGKGHSWYQMTPGPNGVHRNAEKILKPSFGEPGQCFPLKGQTGFVQIRLRTAIIPEAVTLEHVAKSVAYDRSSAPKDCRVSGWLQGGGHNADLAGGNKMFLLAEFIYDLEKSNAQTFNTLETSGAGLVDTVRLDFTSNHGSPSHTCIYRFRVHGREPDSISALATQS